MLNKSIILDIAVLLLTSSLLFITSAITIAEPLGQNQILNTVRDKCSSIIVGKEATADGSMLIAHNEDLGNYSAHHYIYAPRVIHQPGKTVTTHFGAVVPQAPETYAYTATTVFDINYSPGDVTSGINEHLVAVVNNVAYRRDIPDIIPNQGRIMWTELTKFALERSKTAAEAVAVIGSIASTYKLAVDSGMIFGVIDPNEGWWVEVTLDGQWVAQRMENTQLLPAGSR